MKNKIIYPLIFLNFMICHKVFAMDDLTETQQKSYKDLVDCFKMSTFLDTPRVENDSYNTDIIASIIDQQIERLSLSSNQNPQKKCHIVENCFRSSIRHKDGQIIKKILEAFDYNRTPTRFLLSSNDPTIHSIFCFSQLTSWAVCAQDIYGYQASIQLLSNHEDIKLAHRLSFKTFLKQKVLNKKFIRVYGQIIDYFVTHHIFNKKHTNIFFYKNIFTDRLKFKLL
jgi:hypothetical protein